jgi:hypothetical protein
MAWFFSALALLCAHPQHEAKTSGMPFENNAPKLSCGIEKKIQQEKQRDGDRDGRWHLAHPLTQANDVLPDLLRSEQLCQGCAQILWLPRL